MFTGIVSGRGHVQKIIQYKDYTSLIIKAPKGFSKNLLKSDILGPCFLKV